MKAYLGFDTKKKGLLIDELRRTKAASTLYVSDFFFALNDGTDLIFFYNPMFYWDKLPLSNVKEAVLKNLEKTCAVFINFDPDGEPQNKAFENKVSYPAFVPDTPRIGNHYACFGSRIVSHHKQYYFLDDFGGCNTCHSKELTDFDLHQILQWAVLTQTPHYISSIQELDCFLTVDYATSNTLIGAVIGDVIGSVYEWNNIKTTAFDLFHPKCDFTDDTVLTIAVADCLINQKEFGKTIWLYGRTYEGRGYGRSFKKWLQEEHLQPYGSFGNGSAMRASAVGFVYQELETVLEVAKQTAEVTHHHPEGIKGAQATAAAVALARQGASKQEIKAYISQTFGYDLNFTLDAIRPTYTFDVSCQGSVPQAIVAFLESTDFENAIRLAISIGGDSDTIACITGAIAAAYYKQIPKEILDFVWTKLPSEFVDILLKFDEVCGKGMTISQ